MAFEAPFDRSHHCFKDCFPLLQYVYVPKAKDRPAIGDDEAISDSIILAADMLTAIDFDDELAVSAGEIDEVRAYRQLPYEFMAVQSAVAQLQPERGFCIVVGLTQAPCALGCVYFWPTHALPLTLTLSP
ncbi:hypothetical protein X759_14995 [Mesorhizobium sp. LSHC420B00]|nr:hypothetical protein X759_14995 [Mesorhizobium sp. LSHC420B00]